MGYLLSALFGRGGSQGENQYLSRISAQIHPQNFFSNDPGVPSSGLQGPIGSGSQPPLWDQPGIMGGSGMEDLFFPQNVVMQRLQERDLAKLSPADRAAAVKGMQQNSNQDLGSDLWKQNGDAWLMAQNGQTSGSSGSSSGIRLGIPTGPYKVLN